MTSKKHTKGLSTKKQYEKKMKAIMSCIGIKIQYQVNKHLFFAKQ
jgi:hypothetical protein